MTQQSSAGAHRGKQVSRAEFARMWRDPNIPARQIAETLNVSVQAVTSRAATRGLPKRKGGGGMNRKLDPVMFRAMWDANVRAKDIAAYFGLSHQNSISKRAREWGFPRRNCNRWNMVSMLRFLMEKTAKAERDAMWSSEMMDGKRRKK